MSGRHKAGQAGAGEGGGEWFWAAAGCLIGLAILKFGNPVILDSLVEAPGSLMEFLIQPWPILWGYSAFLLVAVLGAWGGRWDFVKRRVWLWVLPAGWLGWQFMASIGSVDAKITSTVLPHFMVCVACFYLGAAARGSTAWFWRIVAVCVFLALWSGAEQHYGGLEAVRQYVYAELDWKQLPEEYLRKISSDRIFSTLVYPNAFAAAILLLGPPLGFWLWGRQTRWPRLIWLVTFAIFLYLGLACFYWTGSKAGWLVGMGVAGLAFLKQPLEGRVKWPLAAAVLAVGLIAFGIRYAPYFREGAPSAVARSQYWSAALETALDKPLLGSGPGTFGRVYGRIKEPEAEMTRLVHNDYLEQASDSGWLGAMLYLGWVGGALVLLGWKVNVRQMNGWVWLGLCGLALHALFEFPLYIPALAWPFFLLLGRLSWEQLVDGHSGATLSVAR